MRLALKAVKQNDEDFVCVTLRFTNEMRIPKSLLRISLHMTALRNCKTAVGIRCIATD